MSPAEGLRQASRAHSLDTLNKEQDATNGRGTVKDTLAIWCLKLVTGGNPRSLLGRAGETRIKKTQQVNNKTVVWECSVMTGGET